MALPTFAKFNQTNKVMYFERPFCREDIVSLAQTKQPFRDLNCYYRQYKQVTQIKERGGIEYVSVASVYGNGMRPETEMTMTDAVNYLNTAPGLEFLPFYER